MEEKDKGIGHATLGYGTDKQREVPFDNYMQFEFADHRLITISELEKNQGFIAVVENPESTGRSAQEKMFLSEISLKGLVCSAMMYFASKGVNWEEEVKTLLDKDMVDYRFGGNIKPIFDNEADTDPVDDTE